MKINRRTLMLGAGAALGAPAIVTNARAQAAVTLKLHSFLPPISNPHAKLLAPWVKQIEADSQGRLKIDIFPSMQLGGTLPQLYDQARDGVVDIIWTLPGATPGRFPTTEVMELPFIGAQRGIVNSRAAQELANAHMKDEVKDVKLLSYWAHDAGHIHATRQIKTMDDLKGLKLRSPTRLAGEALKALGATGVPICGDPGWAGANQVPDRPIQYQRDHYPGAPKYTAVGPQCVRAVDGPPRDVALEFGRKRVVWYAEGVHHWATSLNPAYKYEGASWEGIQVHVLYQPGDEESWGRGVATQRTVSAGNSSHSVATDSSRSINLSRIASSTG